ncbi:MAG: response regulator [bacterium]|nr:response regulator [bacterium]
MNQNNQKKILIVEDEVPTALALGDKLEHEGYTVLRAVDGKEGLRLALLEHPDLVLADLRLPGMSGMEMITALRKDPWGATVKVMILTNISDVESIDEAMRQNTFHYIMKSDTTMQNVLEKIQAQLGETEK